MPVKKIRVPLNSPSSLQGDLFAERSAPVLAPEPPPPPLPRVEEPVLPPSPRPSRARGEDGRGTRPAAPERTAPAESSEVVRVDLEPSRPRERVAVARWSTTEVVRIELPGSPVPVRAPERVVLTVTQLTQAVKGTLVEGFRRVLVRGEVSNFRGAHASGHLFFKLKDAGASIDVKIWASTVQRLRFRLEEGMEVIAEGALDVYEKAGQYNLIVQRIEPSGAGALALAFAQLRERLTQEGLMGERRIRPPRPVPFLPRRIGVVTSRSGAALHDFLRVLHRRNPRLSVLLCHARVQGPGAAEEVVRALQRLQRTDVDVIVVTRGGGSAEDLWTFNEESVARAIAATAVPVVSAVGHEVDFTIADFVADARAPTPSAAAEMLAPELEALEDGLHTARSRLRHGVQGALARAREALSRPQRRLSDPRQRVSSLRHRLVDAERFLGRWWSDRLRSERQRLGTTRTALERFRPETLLAERRSRLERLRWRLAELQRTRLAEMQGALTQRRQRLERRAPSAELARARTRLEALRTGLERAARTDLAGRRATIAAGIDRLHGLSPLRVMGRGYAVVYRGKDERLVRTAAELAVGDTVELRWAPPGCESLQGCDRAEATITSVQPGSGPSKPAAPPLRRRGHRG